MARIRGIARYPFVLGQRPSIGDFGLFGPLYAHLYRDPYSGRLLKAQAPHVVAWIERMNAPAMPKADPGEFLPDDQVPPTLIPILSRMFREQVPVLLDTAKRVHSWAQSHEEVRLPRTLGTHRFSMQGHAGERNVYPYAQWMWQRPHTLYQRLVPEERARLQPFLALIPGAEQALMTPIPQPLVRRANHLELAD